MTSGSAQRCCGWFRRVLSYIPAVTATGADVIPPQVVSQVTPLYPPAAEAARFEGSVTLAAEILKDGSIREVAILESDPPGLGFEQAATDAVKQWRFDQAAKDGRAVESYTVVRLHFRVPTASMGPRAQVYGDTMV